MNRNLQPALFNPGPVTPDRSMWHYTPEDDWDSTRRDPAHVGTQKAALDISMNVHEPASHDSGSLHRLDLGPRAPMMNTPTRPVSDEMANEAFGGPSAYNPDVEDLPVYDTEYWDRRDSLNAGGSGVYYRNAAEDPGSISAVVTRPDKNLAKRQSFRVIPPTLERDVYGESSEPGRSGSTVNHLPWKAKIGDTEARVVAQDRLFEVPMNHKMRRLGEARLERFR